MTPNQEMNQDAQNHTRELERRVAEGRTPGEWARNIPPASKYPTIFSGRNTHVCYLNTQGKSESELETNCNLIVAAPVLLEALQELADLVERYDEAASYSEAYAKARQALSLAAGGGK